MTEIKLGKHLSELISKDRWFEKNPDKVLGEPISTTNRFGKLIEEISGSWQGVEAGIDTSEADLPEVIESKWENDTPLDLTPAKEENLKQAIVQTEISQKDMIHRKKMDLDLNQDEFLDFDSVLTSYNPGISDEEIRAWVWMEINLGRMPYLPEDSGWQQYRISPEEEKAKLDLWLKDGLVCFYRGSYITAPLYYAESISKRLLELEEDKALLILGHGEQQYKRQLEGLRRIEPVKLALDDTKEENRLILSPYSEFTAQNYLTRNSNGNLLRRIVPLLEYFEDWIYTVPTNDLGNMSPRDIIGYLLKNKRGASELSKSARERQKRKAVKLGKKLFNRFLAKGISEEDRKRIESEWNARYNNWVEVNYDKIPVGFSLSKTFKNKPIFIRPAQREGVGFITARGSGCIAYDVGLGKTMTSILSLAQAMESGRCRRPLIVVPNATYENWLNELRGRIEKGKLIQTGLLPQYPVNGLFNLSASFLDLIKEEEGAFHAVGEFSISVMTYEGFAKLGFNESTWNQIGQEMFSILNQGIETTRERVALSEKIDEMMGKGLSEGAISIETLGFDYLVIDEAHAAKKSFTRVKGELSENYKGVSRSRSPYAISSGEPSSIALRAFMMARYIQRLNATGNTLLLTATPFTNSPLEIYSMLALIAFEDLEHSGIHNIKAFFDHYIRTSTELVINAKLQPERKEVVTGFNNLVALRQLIRRFINYKTGEEAGIIRPNKLVLPMKKEDGEMLLTQLAPGVEQAKHMELIENYVREKIGPDELCPNDPTLSKLTIQDDDGRILRGLSYAAQITLSPWLFPCTSEEPTFKQYVEDSPKILYAVKCIESVKKHALENGLEMPGQVIYMNAGVRYFPLIKKYLVDSSGFKKSEIGMISGGMSAIKKEKVKNHFLSGEVKVLLGSATIREGINLQYRATDLYVLWLDWNPTDVKQLEGRIWRQGNRYSNVRIVFPLIEDSIDIFRFQKLQEKTGRINEIWEEHGRRNSLDLEEFNPAELKRALIKDPEALAELTLIDQRERLLDEIAGLQDTVMALSRLANYRKQLNNLLPKIEEIAATYKSGTGKGRGIKATLDVLAKKIKSDGLYTKDSERNLLKEASRYYRRFTQGNDDILAPRGIPKEFLFREEQEKIHRKINGIKLELNQKAGPEAIANLAEDIREERAKNEKQSATIEERVKSFSELNELVIGKFDLQGENTKVDSKPEEELSMNAIRKKMKALRTLVDLRKRLEKLSIA